jgi:hypothetical protein
VLQAESNRRSSCALAFDQCIAASKLLSQYHPAAQPNKGFQCCYAQAQFPMGYYAQSAGWGMPVSATPIRTSANIKPFFSAGHNLVAAEEGSPAQK